ncbi:hypothetical protein AB8U03_15150 [Clostridium sp. Mt-5]|uniref:Tyr recombinase domain-containing protein n=1 Tax=Clostridium moutaii TaxID=3240932 RepID=A0ABV4BU06_9CLOT
MLIGSKIINNNLGYSYWQITDCNDYRNKCNTALLGHIDIDTTRKTYIHVSEEKKKEATILLDNFLD